MEFILGQPIMDWQYETIIKLIKYKREGKKIAIARGSNYTSIHVVALMLDGILPEKIIFDEFR